jgi:hypothetical protein
MISIIKKQNKTKKTLEIQVYMTSPQSHTNSQNRIRAQIQVAIVLRPLQFQLQA